MTVLGVCIIAGLWCGVLFIGGTISEYIERRLSQPEHEDSSSGGANRKDGKAA